MFANTLDLAGAALQAELALAKPRTLPDTQGFVAEMNLRGAWAPVPIRMAGAQPGGPAQDDYFRAFVADVAARLKAAGPLDAVFISAHGAALCESEDDPEGVLFECIRNIVGPQVPVVAVLDLHANMTFRSAQALSCGLQNQSAPRSP
jgi:microcystin degradation protein MlrC